MDGAIEKAKSIESYDGIANPVFKQLDDVLLKYLLNFNDENKGLAFLLNLQDINEGEHMVCGAVL